MRRLRRSTPFVLLALALAFGTFFAPVNAANDLTVDKLTVNSTANMPTLGVDPSHQHTIPNVASSTFVLASQVTTTAASVALTGQTASISDTSLIATPVANTLYRIIRYLVVTSTGTSTNLVGNTKWTDPAAARTANMTTVSCAATNYQQDELVLYVTSAAIPITYGTSMTGSCTYSLYIKAERL